MKRVISLALSIVLTLCIFSVCVSAADFNAASVFSISKTKLSSDKITYTVSIAKNITVNAAVIYAKFDKNVFSCSAAECKTVDEDGDENPIVSGTYEKGIKYFDDQCYSVGFMSMSGFKTGTSAKKFAEFTFTVKSDADRTKTSKIEFYCQEFRGTYNFDKKTDNQLIKSYNKVLLNTPVVTATVSSPVTKNTVNVSWGAVKGAVSYTIYRSTDKDKTGDILKENYTSLSFKDTSVKTGNAYYYTVKAKNSAGLSDISNTVAAVLLAKPVIKSIGYDKNGVIIKWNTVNNADGYYVYRKMSNAASYSRIKTVSGGSAVSYVDKTAKAGTKYVYTLKAYKSGFPASVSATAVNGIKLGIPAVTAANCNGYVKVSWNLVSGADKYVVYRKTSSGSWKTLASTGGSTKSYKDKTAKNNTTYYYTVKPYFDSCAGSYKSSSAIKYIAAPEFSGVSSSGSGITLKWGKVTGASGYYLYRKTPSGSYSKTATIKSGSTVSYTDKTAKASTKYVYAVKAYNGKTTSASGTADAAKLSTPAVTVAKVKGGIKASWGKIKCADSYIVYKKTGSGSWKKLATVKGNANVTYTDKSVKKGTKYYYAVKAVYSGCTSTYKSSSVIKY